MKKQHILPALFALFLFSCSSPQQEEAAQAAQSGREQTSVTEDPIGMVDTIVTAQDQATPAKPIKCANIGAKIYTDAEPVSHVEYDIQAKTIDSLNKIIPLYDTSLYNQMAVSYFTSLSKDLHGRPFFTPDADSLVDVIMEIMSTRINDGTDIVFLIDKTGSMEDDIAKVQKSMDLILDYLKKFDNVKVAIAEYGDKNWHHDFWYNSTELSYDIKGMKSFLKEYETIGNPDVPESVNDAIVKTVEEMNWTSGNKRLMLVIGDAPSQEGDMSEYTMEQVVAKCDSMNVKFNLYPIIIGLSPMQIARVDNFVKEDFVKAYPNPVNEVLNVEITEDGPFAYEIVDMNGRLIQQGSLLNKTEVISFNNIQNGNYLIQIYNQSLKYYNTKMIMVQHN